MTKTTAESVVELSPVAERFVLHWGEMGTRWGVNRTVAQVHALLYLSPEPLHAEQIASTLDVARSNVSNCLRELQSWGIIRVVHVMGDRRDHFEAVADVWEMFEIILDERKRREIDPTLAMLRECAEDANRSDPVTQERITDLLGFFETISRWYEQVRKLPRPARRRLFKFGARIRKVLGG